MSNNNEKNIANLSLPPCYIYFYHTDEWFQLPQYPETITDSMESTFSSQNALARTAPVFSYSNSGPRSIQIQLNMHRDMVNQLNTTGSNIHTNEDDDLIKSDYVDLLIRKLQSVALPAFNTSDKSINPPRVAVRFGEQIFIKGVVASGGVTVTYGLPLLSNNKYAKVDVSFNVSEDQPYDAESVGRLGSFRGLTSGLRSKMGGTSTINSATSTISGSSVNQLSGNIR